MRKSVKQLQSSRKPKPQTNDKNVRQNTNPKPMWGWFAGAAVLIAAFAVSYPMIEMRQRLDSLQVELGRMSKAAGRARSGAVTLKQELEKAKAERNALQGQLVEATSRIEQLSDDIEGAEAAFDNRRARLKSVRNQVEGAAQTAEQAEAQATEDDEKVASLKTELDEGRAKSNGLRAKIEPSQTDIERLRTQLETSQSQLLKLRDHLTKVEGALRDSKQTAEQAAAEAAALKNQTSTLKTEFEAGKAERDALRKKLDQANAYIEQLKDTSLGASGLGSGADGATLELESVCEARDYLIRTIVFEGSGETEIGKVAIAYVVLNRKRSGRWGNSIEDVVTSPWQFEPWMTRRDAMKKLATTDPRYKDAARIADEVLMGNVSDPTEGATYFLNPVIVRQRRGGTLPSWARGEGKPFGRHVFYAPNNEPRAFQQSDARRLEPTALFHPAYQVPGAG
jgi:spore germination cell wall hydrolase CwlJ-like protein